MIQDAVLASTIIYIITDNSHVSGWTYRFTRFPLLFLYLDLSKNYNTQYIRENHQLILPSSSIRQNHENCIKNTLKSSK